jgi:hypothetical protein
MIALKVEKLGDRLAVVLTPEAQDALALKEGDIVHLEAPGAPHSTWEDDPHARGRAFLKRYHKSLSQLES